MSAQVQEQIEFRNGFQPRLRGSGIEDSLNRYALLSELQKQLDPDEVMITLLNEIGDRLGVIGLRFEATGPLSGEAFDQSIEIFIGRNFGESVSLQVSAESDPLGMLTVYGVRARLVADLGELEIASECLAFPMRNALMYREASALARRDALTGAGSRLAFDEALEMELARGERSGAPFSLLIVDVNDFKRINDEYGHLNGDHTLCMTYRLIKEQLREGDACFRVGGDEFAVVLHRSDFEGALSVSARIRRAIEAQRILSPFSVAIGASQWRAGLSRDELIARADRRMYQAKQGEVRVPSSATGG